MQAKLSAEELIQRLARAAHLQDDETGEVAWTCRYALEHIAALERELEEAKRSAWAMSQDVTTLGQQVEALASGEKP